MKKTLSLLLTLVLATTLLLSGCVQKPTTNAPATNAPAAEAKTYTLRVAHVLPTSHATHITLEQVFKKEVEEKSNGRIKVEIYPNAQLGGDRQTVEALNLGTLEMCVPAGSVLAGFDEKFMVLDLPFLFKTKEAAFKAFDGEFGTMLSEGLKSKNIINLGYGENGYRNITNNKAPITKPEDLKGLKIRTMENPVHISTFKAFGANPTPMAFGELFTALQQKTVDAQENPTAIIYTSKFYEVQKYLSLTGHVYANCPYLISKTFYESLPTDLQKVVSDAANLTVDEQRKMTGQQEKEFFITLKENGMQINELTSEQKELFIKAAETVYQEFEKKYGSDLVNAAKASNN